jgi:hypothetical protein
MITRTYHPTLLGAALMGALLAPPVFAADPVYVMRVSAPGLTASSVQPPVPNPAPPQEAPPVTAPGLVLQDPSGNALDSLAFPGTAIGEASATLAVVLANTGNAPLAFDWPASTLSGPFSIASTNCPAELAPTASCTLSLAFTPATDGSSTGALSVRSNAGGDRRVALSGTGTRAVLAVSAATSSFGARTVGTTMSRSVTLSNTGTGPTDLVFSSLAAPYSRNGGTCGATLAAGTSCSVSVAFSPSTIGSTSAVLAISGGPGVAPQTVTYSGSGNAFILAASASVPFGSQALGSATPHTLTVSNTGNISGALSLTGLSAPFAKTGGTCGTTLAAGASCTVVVTYSPTAKTTSTGTLTLGSSSGASPSTATYTGTGAAAVLGMSPASLAYGAVAAGSSTNKPLTVTNTGLVAASLTVSGEGSGFTRTGGTCGATLAAGASCTVIVTYTPTGGISHSRNLTIAGGSGVTSATIPMSGSVTGQTLSITSAATDYSLYNAYVTAFGTPTAAVNLTVTLSASVTIKASSTSTAAFVTGTFPSGSVLQLVNNGRIIGKGGIGGQGGHSGSVGMPGGAGGPAISLQSALSIDNKGFIGGGGGGGAGSKGKTYTHSADGGGGGGGGAGYGVGGNGGYGNPSTGNSGSAGTAVAGGLGGFAGYNYTQGGNGGEFGLAGGSVTSVAGGAPGLAVSLGGRAVTWISGNTATAVKGLVQ